MRASFTMTPAGAALIAVFAFPVSPASGQGTDASAAIPRPAPQIQVEVTEAERRQALADAAELKRQQGFRSTRAVALDQSLEDLLNAGWTITAAGQAPAGPTFALRDRDGRQWAYCILTPGQPGIGAQQQVPASQCRALN
jgi:hypothetical protein